MHEEGRRMKRTGRLLEFISRVANVAAIILIVTIAAAAFLDVGRDSTFQLLDPKAWFQATVNLLKKL
jgi:hypothetical protein